MATESISTPVIQHTSTAIPKLRRRGFIREIIETVILIGAIYALVNLATARFIVEGPSMQPNFETGQFLIVSRINYLFGNPNYGDIIVFHYPRNTEDDYIKRVIGLPGDTVEIIDMQTYVNGVMINEPYILEDCVRNCHNNMWELGPDEYFVMGDNRNHSSDSRSFGTVGKEFIVGEALIRYWPPQDWGSVHRIRFQR